MNTRHACVLGAWATVAVTVAGAQQTSCVVPPSTRTVPGYIYGTLTQVGGDAMPREYTALLLQNIGEGFPSTSPAALAVYEVSDSIALAAGHASAQFTATDLGRVRDVKLIATSLSPAFDRSLLAALAAADSNALAPPFPDGMHGRPAFELQIETGATADEHLIRRDPSVGISARFVATSIPVWDGAHALRQQGTTQKLTVAHVDSLAAGFMMLTFAVGPDGRIVQNTGERQPGSTPAAVASTLRIPPVAIMMAHIQFEPATINGCAVPALAVEQLQMHVVRVQTSGD
jgi:hypothetical protein